MNFGCKEEFSTILAASTSSSEVQPDTCIQGHSARQEHPYQSTLLLTDQSVPPFQYLRLKCIECASETAMLMYNWCACQLRSYLIKSELPGRGINIARTLMNTNFLGRLSGSQQGVCDASQS